MESGGKAVTKRYRKKITVVLSLVLPVILLFAILNCFTTYVFYEDYKYKMNLMTDIAAKEEFSGLQQASVPGGSSECPFRPFPRRTS